MANAILLGSVRAGLSTLPFISARLSCGFPSPAADYESELVDLNRLMLRHPDASFLAHAQGDSMTGAGIHDGDVLAVDKSLLPVHGDIVVAWVEGECVVKRLEKRADSVALVAENAAYAPVVVRNAEDLWILGVVVTVLHPLVPESRRGLGYVRPG
ncbi:LexA family protein [Hymenobacter armeniacus]|uniref:Translesion error-prone DNA polymerase V autoproteolytic subunit n=1 Tax=Hymenobacter armeniacus TaxID=2771358 RepID=A0ABR8JXX4_9BACT|nr:translesion error-prone DNA polymerase V autoproteolytic subunit [Hymenobacter armeniacus]MBD2722589.1 translesion error-prone DNA polymerase V autoproteolytic subunit [Hymenobacter armeniacus]